MTKTICIPGFLGDSSDYNWMTTPYTCIELFKDKRLLTTFDNFLPRISEIYSLNKPLKAIGYSLGGRLLLNSLLCNPETFERVVIISSHTGITSDIDRTMRIESDLNWAQQFDKNFEQAHQAWSKQAVFNGHKLPRSNNHLNPDAIRHALTTWSLGNMSNLLPKLSTINIPILWIVGSEDLKYAKVASQAANACNKIVVKVIPDCGHRVMWQANQRVKALVDDFLKH